MVEDTEVIWHKDTKVPTSLGGGYWLELLAKDLWLCERFVERGCEDCPQLKRCVRWWDKIPVGKTLTKQDYDKYYKQLKKIQRRALTTE